MSDASLFSASSPETSILLKIKDLPQTSKASGVPEVLS
jgi:hypothetical protein